MQRLNISVPDSDEESTVGAAKDNPSS
jgi:hypothetical protein